MVKKKRVIIAMSGGVDSSVAAALLKKQGYEVIGIFMKLWSPSAEATGDKSDKETGTAARSVCHKLDIPFYVVNFQKEFKYAVVDYYVKEYEEGRTPNPCVICNRDIKGEILMRKALEMEADFLATGHYARRVAAGNPKLEIRNPKLKEYYLYTAKDKTKDQTYFLWTLTQKHLAKLLFPIGDYTKIEVRQMAKRWQLPTAARKESQGICFIPDRDICGFLRRHAKKLTKPGPIFDKTGKKLGLHNGLIDYTIGQRERLGIGGSRAYYVVKLNRRDNSLIVGAEEDLYAKELIARDLNWIRPQISEQIELSKIGGSIRYGHPIEACKIDFESNDQVKVIFDEPQRAIAPGQSIVFYLPCRQAGNSDEVLGGGIIKESLESIH